MSGAGLGELTSRLISKLEAFFVCEFGMGEGPPMVRGTALSWIQANGVACGAFCSPQLKILEHASGDSPSSAKLALGKP